jgi:nucleotide-binding universal stress UspA family protein
MNVLCAVGIRGGAELVRRLGEVAGTGHELHLLHVTDVGPRHLLDHLRHGPERPPAPPAHPAGRPAPPPPAREQRLGEAEEAAAAAALGEARAEAERAGFRCQVHAVRGRPEQEVVALAAQLGCRLVAIRASEGAAGMPRLGPGSVGHTARFVLDHAPCDVLLVRAP